MHTLSRPTNIVHKNVCTSCTVQLNIFALAWFMHAIKIHIVPHKQHTTIHTEAISSDLRVYSPSGNDWTAWYTVLFMILDIVIRFDNVQWNFLRIFIILTHSLSNVEPNGKFASLIWNKCTIELNIIFPHDPQICQNIASINANWIQTHFEFVMNILQIIFVHFTNNWYKTDIVHFTKSKYSLLNKGCLKRSFITWNSDLIQLTL